METNLDDIIRGKLLESFNNLRDLEKTEFEKLMESFSVETVIQTSIVEDLSQLIPFRKWIR